MKNVSSNFNATFLIALVSLSLSACIPSDIPLTEGAGSKDRSYSGFQGVTEVQTIDESKLKVSWVPSSNPEVVAYNVYDASNFFAPTLLATAIAPSSSITLNASNDIQAQKIYNIRVRAANKFNIEDSNTAQSVGIPYGGITSIEVLTATSARINYNSVSEAESAKVYCKQGVNGQFALTKTESNTALTSTTITGLSPGVTYYCRTNISINSTEDNNTKTLSFTPIGQAARIEFLTQPGSSNAGSPFSPQPQIAIYDVNDNLVSAGPDSTALITLTLASSSPTIGTIRGPSISLAAQGGIATFSGLNMQEAGGKIITATKSDTSSQPNGSGEMSIDSNPFTISPGTVSSSLSSLTISPASGSQIANSSSLYTVTATLKDQYGNSIVGVRPQFASTVSADTITQPLANTNADGQTSGSISTPIAGMRNLSIASPSGLSGVVVPVEFLHGPATKLTFIAHPTTSPAGANNINNVTVYVQDTQGNTVTTGPASTATISLAIINNVNGAALLGTVSKPAVDGVALFNGLGFDKTGTGYKLSANSSGLASAQSNSFNITAGVPTVIDISGATSIRSGVCADNQITFKLQDNGGNPSNAPFTMSFTLSGLSNGSFYTSSQCTGAPATNTLSFSTGSNTRTLFYRNNSAELVGITATDTSGVISPDTHNISVLPSKVVMSGPTSVRAGACSTAFTITTRGENDNTGPVGSNTPFQINGMGSSTAVFYSTEDCTGLPVNTSAVTIPAGSSSTSVYFKGNRAESLTLSVFDPAEAITPASAPISFNVLPSKINFSGPTSVVSGQCSTTPYVISLRDEENNPVTALSSQTLRFNGLAGAARFYTIPGCTGAGISTNFAIPQGSSSVNLYFSNTAAGITTVHVSDPANGLSNSQTIQIAVSPSDFLINAPVAGFANTNVCAGPFTVTTRDGAGTQTPAITPITANLGGKGIAGDFYPASGCLDQPISALNFATGESSKQFYFMSFYPGNLVLSATHNAGILNTANQNWNVVPAQGWIGTKASSLSWFEQGKFPSGSRFDYPNAVRAMTFDTNKEFLYVIDQDTHKLIKYDYINEQYIGWVGTLDKSGGIGAQGSVVNGSLNAQCSGLIHGAETPGWCFGGQSMAQGGWDPARGSLNVPEDVATGITNGVEYVYVANRNAEMISRFRADTGEFVGWIGRITNNDRPTGPAPGLSNTCSSIPTNGSTPGWCMNGNSQRLDRSGFAGLDQPRLVAFSASAAGGPMLLVAERYSIKRYHAETGEFMGWIGFVNGTPTSSAPDVTNNCASTGNDTRTPGWCMGGTMRWDRDSNYAGGIDHPTGLFVNDSNNRFYVADNNNNGIITEFNLTTGAYVRRVRNGTAGGVTPLRSARQIFIEDGLLYLADWHRVVKMDLDGIIYGWIGKVGNNNSMSGAGCAGLNVNDNTPGWCLGGEQKAGVDESAFSETMAIAYDGNGKFLTSDYRTPWIKRWNLSTGSYDGQLILEANSPKRWTTENVFAGREGYDDDSMYRNYGVHHDSGYLYIAEFEGSRIKKVNVATGETLGWIGGITSKPTGGTSASCLLANAMSISPSWCTGSWLNPQFLWNQVISSSVDGLLYGPIDVTTDDTWLYVLDNGIHRILRYNKNSGDYGGWLGFIAQPPTGGAPGCNGATGFTPGWCMGGTPQSTTTRTGGLISPRSMTYANGMLYVIDDADSINSYLASSGSFMGWTGMINTTPTGSLGGTNCSGTFGQVTNGWCFGGTAREPGVNGADPVAGSFRNYGNYGLAVDSSYIYVSNSYFSRIDRFNFQGVYVDSVKTRWDQFGNGWTNLTGSGSPFGWDGYWFNHIEVSDGYLYGSHSNVAVKYEISTGNVVGWQGAINSGVNLTAPAACVGASGTTPTWCRSPANGWTPGFTPGGFSSAQGIAADDYFIYVSDQGNNRVTRLPK
jgi:hypothetical protein